MEVRLSRPHWDQAKGNVTIEADRLTLSDRSFVESSTPMAADELEPHC